MKKVNLAQTISILANIGVIAGIIFLAIELRQNNELMADEAERARAESIRQGLVSVYESGELAEIIIKDRNDQELTAAEQLRLSYYMLRSLIGYQTSFRQLPREELGAMGNLFRGWAETSPTWTIAWERSRTVLDPDFVQFMEESVLSER